MIAVGSYLRYTKFQNTPCDPPMWGIVTGRISVGYLHGEKMRSSWSFIDSPGNTVERTVYPPGDEPDELLKQRAEAALKGDK